MTRLERAALLRVLYDAKRETVLHRAEWIECLDLHVEIDAFGSELVDPDYRGVSDSFENRGEAGHDSLTIEVPRMFSPPYSGRHDDQRCGDCHI